MHVKRWLSLSAVLVGLCPLLAQDTTVSIIVTGALGPVLSGSDPLGANGESGTISVVVSESLSPTSTTSDSATYTLPPGAITVNLNGTTVTTTSKMRITLPPRSRDTIVLTATVRELGLPLTVVGTAALRHGSFPSTVLVTRRLSVPRPRLSPLPPPPAGQAARSSTRSLAQPPCSA